MDFSEQFITLPSGWKASCNRQGFRHIKTQFSGNVLVTDPNGNFVPCDARVGPPGDDLRTDANGNLLTSDEMDALLRKRQEEKWAQEQTKYATQKAEEDRLTARQQEQERARQRLQQEADDRAEADTLASEEALDAVKAKCRSPYEAIYDRYIDAPSQEGGRQVTEASMRMDACLKGIE